MNKIGTTKLYLMDLDLQEIALKNYLLCFKMNKDGDDTKKWMKTVQKYENNLKLTERGDNHEQ